MMTALTPLRRCWAAVPRTAQNMLLTCVLLAGSLAALWALSPLWQHPTH